MKIQHIASIFAAGLILAGCQSGPPPRPAADPLAAWRVHEQHMSEVKRWRVTGRIAILTEEQAWNASIRWTQDHDDFQIRLTAPLGQGSIELKGGPGAVELRDQDNVVYRATNAEDLLFDTLGWRIPLNGLKYWMRGIPEPKDALDRVVIDPTGRLMKLRQLGWMVEILRYRGLGKQIVPDKLFMKTDRFSTRMVINHWQILS